jgi:TPR repeat protein
LGVKQDKQLALKMFNDAVEMEDASVDAMVNIGNCYLTGDGVAMDQNTAIEWYKKAADKKSKEAIEMLKRLGK